MQEVSGIYAPLLLDTDELKMPLRTRKVLGLCRNGVPEHYEGV